MLLVAGAYHIYFDPDVYPLNMACWDGRVSEHWQHEEHALEVATATAINENVPGVPTPSMPSQKLPDVKPLKSDEAG